MIALGWTEANVTPPPPTLGIVRPEVTLVAVAAETAPDPRARLRLQIACALACPAFLPLAPLATASVEAASAWLEDHRAEVSRGLARLRAQVQITLALRPETAVDVPAEGSWLRARAARAAGAVARRQAAQSALDAALSPLGVDARRLRTQGAGFAVDLLVPRTGAEATMAALEATLRTATPEALRGWSSVVAGPFPAFGFATLGDAA